jgi:ribonuclease D
MSPKKIFHKLKDVVWRELGEELDKEQQTACWGGELTDDMLLYAAKDAEVLPPLREKLAARMEDADLKRVMEIEHRALPAIVWMANAGVPFDVEGWRRHLWSRSRKRRTGWGWSSRGWLPITPKVKSGTGTPGSRS